MSKIGSSVLLREIAAATELSVGTVKSRLNSGLEQLRRRFT